jgi:hypothetical protein
MKRLSFQSSMRGKNARALRKQWEKNGNSDGLNTPRFESLEPRLLMSATHDHHHDHDHDHDDEYELHILPPPDLTIELTQTSGGDVFSSTVSYALSDTFSLASLPGANHTIYLDFDGHVTSGTIWNRNFNDGKDIVTPAFDFDGNPASFSDAELQRIQYIWGRVAEDFLPFNVNVTTIDPGTSALIKSGSSDASWGVRVVIGGSSYDWFGSGAGGVAYVGSFNWDSDTPTFVFEEQLGNGHEKYTAEAISHEAGHTLGLSHDGTSTTGYYEGHGSGETGWAPIMGVGYYQNLVQWSKGEYKDANQKQDDLAIITSQNGFGYRADDHGNTIASASALSVSGSSVSGGGIIERNTDLDVFSFTTGAGSISLNVSPAARGANLDILAELLDSNGNIIASSNPASLLSASISLNVAAGTYYLRIDGVGKGDPLTTGYTDYGSLGQYSISGTIVPAGAGLSINDVTVNESAGFATFTVSLSQASTSPVTVNVATANGSAVAGSDYQAVSITGLTFNPGVTSMTVSVPIIDDLINESTEIFYVNLSSASGATILDGQGVGTILDDDVVIENVTVSVNDTSVTETNPGPRGQLRTTDMVFTVTLSAAASGPVSVQYATADGTAIADSDYTATSGTLIFNAGETSKTVIVKVIGDTLAEPNETFFLNLISVTGAAIADGQGVGTIIDNDSSSGGGGGGKPKKSAVLAESEESGELSSAMLAALAQSLAGKPAPVAVGVLDRVAKTVLDQTTAPLFVFEILTGEQEESVATIVSIKRGER